ncbi:MAG: hypothetical protein R3E76_14760, partial [Planctomycetota bacterium]
MRKPRLSMFNLIQLVITVIAVMFGAYGFMVNGEAPVNAPVVANAAADVGPLDGGTACAPLDLPEEVEPKPVVRRVPQPVGPIAQVACDPDDKGNAT